MCLIQINLILSSRLEEITLHATSLQTDIAYTTDAKSVPTLMNMYCRTYVLGRSIVVYTYSLRTGIVLNDSPRGKRLILSSMVLKHNCFGGGGGEGNRMTEKRF